MTKYTATFYFKATDREITMEFDSATERALAVIGYSPYAEVRGQQCIESPDRDLRVDSGSESPSPI